MYDYSQYIFGEQVTGDSRLPGPEILTAANEALTALCLAVHCFYRSRRNGK